MDTVECLVKGNGDILIEDIKKVSIICIGLPILLSSKVPKKINCLCIHNRKRILVYIAISLY